MCIDIRKDGITNVKGTPEIQPDFNTAGTLDETPKNPISAGPKDF